MAFQFVLAGVFVVVLLAAMGVRLPFGDGGRWQVQVAFTDAGGLRVASRAPVTVAGVDQGTVQEIAYDPARGRAVATLELEPEAHGVLRSDAEASVIPRSALQDLTVDLATGTADRALEEGDWVAPSRSAAPVALDRLVGTLDADTRAQTQVLLAELARGLDGRGGELQEAVERLSDALDPARTLTAAVAERRVQMAALVEELAEITGTLGERDRALTRVLAAARGTLAVTGEREVALADTVSELGPTMTSLRAALGATEALGEPLTPALTGLRPTARALPAALDAVRGATGDGRVLIGALDELTREGAAGVDALTGAAGSLPPLTDDLESTVTDLGSFVAAVDANRDGIGLLGERFSGVLSTSDANGVILRGLGFFEPFDPANFGEPGATGARLAKLETQAVAALVKTCRQENELACLARYLVPGLPGAVR